jgi:hypothetical protein
MRTDGLLQGRKQFFFEKKNQKTFAHLPPASPRQPEKSFASFFKKQRLSYLSLS